MVRAPGAISLGRRAGELAEVNILASLSVIAGKDTGHLVVQQNLQSRDEEISLPFNTGKLLYLVLLSAVSRVPQLEHTHN